MLIIKNDIMTDRIITSELSRLIKSEPVILCIGSDRVTGDCVGPLTGHLLKEFYRVPLFVYGGLEAPVTALNLVKTISFIKLKHPFSPVVAVDSSVGDPEEVGCIRIFKGGLCPGSASGKALPRVGDVSVTATVSESGKTALSGVRLGLVYSLASAIARGLSRINPINMCECVAKAY